MRTSATARRMLEAAAALRDCVDELSFAPPVSHTYNPLNYAWDSHAEYIRSFASGPRRVVLLGMNPGPFGMMQTGVPFGEIPAVRDWMGIHTNITPPPSQHPKRPIEGFECSRSEVSGRRLWGLFAERFKRPEAFFAEHFVVNFCPLAFLEDSGRNRTPDKLPASEVETLYEICRDHLRKVVAALKPEWVVGVGAFAENQARESLLDSSIRFGRILHPSPASPAANRGWAEAATRQLESQGIW